MSRRRKLRPEELELWQKVADSAERMGPERKAVVKTPPKPPRKRRQIPEEPPAEAIPPFRLGQRAGSRKPPHDILPPLPDRLDDAPLRMDKKTHGRMTRGKMVPEARIDLHGMTVDRAHTALRAFILRAVQNDMRLVLVITGKGRVSDESGPIPVRHGILRHNLPQWLSTPPLSQLVLQVTASHRKHGGMGAYYVYLRRSR